MPCSFFFLFFFRGGGGGGEKGILGLESIIRSPSLKYWRRRKFGRKGLKHSSIFDSSLETAAAVKNEILAFTIHLCSLDFTLDLG